MKRCGHCHEDRDDAQFGLRDRRTGRKHTICIQCRRGFWRAYYHRFAAKIKERRSPRHIARRLRNRAYVDEYLRERACVDCGLVDPTVMEFDHVRGKKIREVSTLVRECAPIARIEAEIAKCEVRCANCHRRKTSRELWKKPAARSLQPLTRQGQVSDGSVINYSPLIPVW